MRVIFMGTPDFAVPALERIAGAGYDVAAVVTQPDKPKGRGKEISMPPVKCKALKLQIPVYQPVKVREPEFVKVLKELEPDVIVVAAFGQILSKEVLDIPRYGCINIHASLLPKYRGASPIQWAVINGEKESGITTMMMDVGLDTGDILEQAVIPLDKKETGGSLFDKLSAVGGELILSTLKKLSDGTLTRTPQPEEGISHVKVIKKSFGDIDWTMDAESIERLIRGLNPWPSAYTRWNGKMLKIWDASVCEDDCAGACGEVVHSDKDSLHVKTGRGILAIEILQPEGKKRMDAAAFLRGYPVPEGTRFERSEE